MTKDWDALLQEADQDFPEAIILNEENPRFVGEFVKVEKGTTSYGDRLIAIMRDPTGNTRSLWLIHTVLKNEFVRARPCAGERIAVVWKGKVKGGGGFTYDKYRVVVDRAEETVDWETVAATDTDDGVAVEAANSFPVSPHNRRDVEELSGVAQTTAEVGW
jgi:hypothetical protein